MATKLNVKKVITQEFKKEMRRLGGHQPFDKIIPVLREQFDLNSVQRLVDTAMAEKEAETMRKYHRNNLRYLAKYYAQTLHNQLKSIKLDTLSGLKDEKLLKDTLKVFKSNPQCKVYH